MTDYFTTAKNCLAASFQQQQQVFIYQGIPKRSVTAEDTCVHHHKLVRKNLQEISGNFLGPRDRERFRFLRLN